MSDHAVDVQTPDGLRVRLVTWYLVSTAFEEQRASAEQFARLRDAGGADAITTEEQ